MTIKSANPECTVVVVLQPLPGATSEIIRIIGEELSALRQLDGCLRYDLLERVDGVVVLIEEWANKSAWQRQFDTAPIERLKRELTPLLEKPAARWELYAPD